MTEYPRYRFEAVFKSGKIVVYEGESAFDITSACGMGSGVFEQISHVRATPLNEAARLESETH
jgi:hypothetical protein